MSSYLVEPYKQIQIGLVFLLLNLVFSALIFGIFGYYVSEMYASVSEYFKLTGGAENIVWAKFQTPIIVGLILLVVFILITFWVSITYTHRLYGPLVSVNRYLDELADGKEIGPLKLRHKDELGGMADRLNRAISRLRRP
jgi:methyl-accepting chemotaxis protein